MKKLFVFLLIQLQILWIFQADAQTCRASASAGVVSQKIRADRSLKVSGIVNIEKVTPLAVT